MKILILIIIFGSFYFLIQALQMSDNASIGTAKFTQEGIQNICYSIELVCCSILVLIIDLFFNDQKK